MSARSTSGTKGKLPTSHETHEVEELSGSSRRRGDGRRKGECRTREATTDEMSEMIILAVLRRILPAESFTPLC